MAAPLKKISTENAPNAIGPYSQAVVAGDFLFASGQIALDPKTGNLVPGGIKEQTKQVIDNLEAVSKARNIGLERVVKTTVYLKDLAHFSEMNEVYAQKFVSDPKPARETVQVAKLPRDALVEISCVAYMGD